ncbi:hypothetical protein [Delftia acidovorans]|uniref:hypothetical protein n=1 Tax=Delftia acidovorans TaxID=80866 RepID=UPI001C0C0FEB|nr:hypothetical protein [Delftia acidovorans]
MHELEFIKIVYNHLELDRKLNTLNCSSPIIQEHADFIGKAWFNLGDEHLKEAKSMATLAQSPKRAIYSRTYYAAYSASKSIRYLTAGAVSLKGDDHGKATDLPHDFPDKENWANTISKLYENRLRADYDNWTSTPTDYSQNIQDAINSSEAFIIEARNYINNKKGCQI